MNCLIFASNFVELQMDSVSESWLKLDTCSRELTIGNPNEFTNHRIDYSNQSNGISSQAEDFQ